MIFVYLNSSAIRSNMRKHCGQYQMIFSFFSHFIFPRWIKGNRWLGWNSINIQHWQPWRFFVRLAAKSYIVVLNDLQKCLNIYRCGVPLTRQKVGLLVWRLERQFIENSIIGVDQQVIIDKLDNKTLLKVLNEWFEMTLKIISTIENGILFIIFIGLTLVSYVRMRDSIDSRF